MFQRIGFAAAALALLAGAQPAGAQPRAGAMQAFSSDTALRAFFKKAIGPQRSMHMSPPADVVAAPPPPSMAPSQSVGEVVVTGSRVAAGSITNNQVGGVDEGDIVKQRGDTLVILRRGRLFSVSIAGGGLKPISHINAYAPGVDGSGDWYDEMLIAGDRVIVIGYSYARGGTQVNRFTLDAAGRLRFEDSYQFRSSDYYSTRNYASRLVGHDLYLYAPLPLRYGVDPLSSLPAMRQWTPGRGGDFRRLASAQHVYAPRPLLRRPWVDTLHSVSRCDVTAPRLQCDATVVLGGEGRSFFVSQNAVYVWTQVLSGSDLKGPQSLLYRMPLNGAAPSALEVRGAPVDQFSFSADVARRQLHVLVRADSGGDAMWRPEVSAGAAALLNIPISAFGDGSEEVPLRLYQPLPTPDGWNFHNHFVGDHLLYAANGGEGDRGRLFAVAVATGQVTPIVLDQDIDRIDVIGQDGIVIGDAGQALAFTTIRLDGPAPRAADRYVAPDAAEGESRSHAFFFNPTSADGTAGVLGLPVTRTRQSIPGRVFGSSAGILFLTRTDRRLAEAGALDGSPTGASDPDDACQASCTDWYGNARPIFLDGRIFALLGYELVEGRLAQGRIRELGRQDFGPHPEGRRKAGHISP